MAKRVCRTPNDLREWSRYLYEMADSGDTQFPLTCLWVKGDDRSLAQNRLIWKWATEISMQKGDMTPGEVHAFNKLTIGVPLRREIDEDFRAVYDERIRPLSYEAKLAIMSPPIDLPVTRDLTTKGAAEYSNRVYDYWVGQGMRLTVPEPL